MPNTSTPLTIGLSTSALFDLREEHAVFERDGVHAYAALQLAREKKVIATGTAFEVVKRLLSLNQPDVPLCRSA